MAYSTTVGNKICQLTATSSKSIMQICEELNLSHKTVTDWIFDKNHELHAKYAQAKVMQLFHLKEEIRQLQDGSLNETMEVSKNGKVKKVKKEAAFRTKIRIEARMAILTKLNTFIDFRDTNETGKNLIPRLSLSLPGAN